MSVSQAVMQKRIADGGLATGLRETMEERGVNLKATAEQMGVSTGVIARALKGHAPRRGKCVDAIAKWLGVPPVAVEKALSDLDGEPKPKPEVTSSEIFRLSARADGRVHVRFDIVTNMETALKLLSLLNPAKDFS